MSFTSASGAGAVFYPPWIGEALAPLQRAERRRQFLDRAEKADAEDVVLRVAKAAALVPSWSASVSLYPSLPLRPQAIDEAGKAALLATLGAEEQGVLAKFASKKGIQHVSLNEFQSALNETVLDFLAYLHSLPADERGYIIATDLEQKSSRWVLSLALEALSFLPPRDVLEEGSDIYSYVIEHKEVRHIVYLDDAAHSGMQLSSAFYDKMPTDYTTHRLTFHVCIPYLTRFAITRLETTAMGRRLASIGTGAYSPFPLRIAKHRKIVPVCDYPRHFPADFTAKDVEVFSAYVRRMEGDGSRGVTKRTFFMFDHKHPDDISVVDKAFLSKVATAYPPPYKEEFSAEVALRKDGLKADQDITKLQLLLEEDDAAALEEEGMVMGDFCDSFLSGGKLMLFPKVPMTVMRGEIKIVVAAFSQFPIEDGDCIKLEELQEIVYENEHFTYKQPTE